MAAHATPHSSRRSPCVAAHCNWCAQVVLDRLLATRDALRGDPLLGGTKLTLLPLLIKARPLVPALPLLRSPGSSGTAPVMDKGELRGASKAHQGRSEQAGARARPAAPPPPHAPPPPPPPVARCRRPSRSPFCPRHTSPSSTPRWWAAGGGTRRCMCMRTTTWALRWPPPAAWSCPPYSRWVASGRPCACAQGQGGSAPAFGSRLQRPPPLSLPLNPPRRGARPPRSGRTDVLPEPLCCAGAVQGCPSDCPRACWAPGAWVAQLPPLLIARGMACVMAAVCPCHFCPGGCVSIATAFIAFPAAKHAHAGHRGHSRTCVQARAS